MDKIMISLLIIAVLLVVGGVIANSMINKKISSEEEENYQGPVPEGYDEEYFRETGITKKTEDE